MAENRAFEEMRKAALERLAGRDPVLLAQRADVAFDGERFSFQSLGERVTVSWPDCRIQPALDPWQQLVILHYLDLAEGTPLTGEWITFAQQKDGFARGSDFDRKAEREFQQRIGVMPPEALRARCAQLGGRETAGKADLRFELPFLPRYPVAMNLWFADEDFPASGRLLLDSSAEHYLTIEDSVTVGALVLAALGGGTVLL